MGFYLLNNNGRETFQFPVNPPSYKITGGGRNYTDVNVIKLGETTTIGDGKLIEVSFSSFFPKFYDSYCEYKNIPEPQQAVALLNKWRSLEQPVRLIITDANINIPVTIRTFDIEERGGEPGDIYFDISFKEYKFIKIRTITTTTTTTVINPQAQSRPNLKSQTKTYTVKSGDSLWNIAKKTLGNGSRWKEIYNLNSKVIGENPNLIYPGQVYVLPDK